MDCQECQKRPATIHFTKIINGKKMEYHLCDQCAKEKDEVMSSYSGFSIHNLLSGMLNFDQPMEERRETQKHSYKLQCPKCGLTYSEFAKIGKFGCGDCYQTFSDKIDPILRKVHSGNTSHTGKIPKRVGKDISFRRQIKDLKTKLRRYVEDEEFEKAAELRDEIRAMENRGEE